MKKMGLPTLAGVIAAMIALGAWRYEAASDDRDHDGLSDQLEARLAERNLPILHQYATGSAQDDCLAPDVRPILFRARPYLDHGLPDRDAVAITYVLLYAEDCGALGHPGDAESFTILVRHDRNRDDWQTIAGQAVAHEKTPLEYRSFGTGNDIWVSRNKHANFAAFSACGDNEISGDICAEFGPAPAKYSLLNVGEPDAPLADDIGAIDRMFTGSRIWHHDRFFEAGDITAQLTEAVDFSTLTSFRKDHQR